MASGDGDSVTDQVEEHVDPETPLGRLLAELTQLSINEQEAYTQLERRYEEAARQREAAFSEARAQLERDRQEERRFDLAQLSTSRAAVHQNAIEERRQLIRRIHGLAPQEPVPQDIPSNNGHQRRNQPRRVGVPVRPVNVPRELPIGTRVRVLNSLRLAQRTPARNLEGRVISVGSRFYTLSIWNPTTRQTEEHRRQRNNIAVITDNE